MNIDQRISFTDHLRQEAERYIAGGVVSLNRKVEPAIMFSRGKGSKIYDVDGKEYIDYHAAFAPHLLGHNNDIVNDAVIEAIKGNKSLFGTGTNEWEVQLCSLLCNAIPSLEMVQITNTGSEATAHAIRLSRAYTGREDIIVMMGGYNGWHNEVARQVTPSLTEVGRRVHANEYSFIPLSAGIPEETKRKVHIVNFNDLESVEYVMRKYPIACVLTEPVLQNIGVVLPKPGYLAGLYALCERYGALCIFDEVKTGFRSGLGGYQEAAGITPHLSVFGKAVANGYPLGVIGGRKDIMQLFDSQDPSKRVLISGTYNAHPVNAAAAIATISMLQNRDVFHQISAVSDQLYTGLEKLFFEKGVTTKLAKNASAFCLYFMEKVPADLHDILENHNHDFDLRYRRELIKNGIYHIPVACKQGSVSYAHTPSDIDLTLDITREVLKSI